ncbi:l-asparaginase ii [Heliomicrobium modesticaldum Ice1]|uniref:L-asparaginase ii n=1 Tax=Heliobacterium modesticaldum (strain ATCC 51547 / Ice1) TaxID=498761 RepID=B0TE87_HELMI|nr:asparaginase [Heliomicrobium modesticaldum]ABZ84282.1 l-asparaginase ii [Heliomicrobium modesticaldum Ice1]
MSAVLVEVVRGAMVENRHRGAIVVVDGEGRRVASVGEPSVTYMRSSSKPLMTLPLVEQGGLEQFGLGDEHLAIFASSHAGEEEHRRVVLESLQRIGLAETALACGTHTPFDRKTADALRAAGQKPTVLHCNCSGKHTGVLAYALFKGYPIDNYCDPKHPAEVEILTAVADMAGVKPEDVVIGVDGCSIPVYGMPLENIALSFARLGLANYGTAERRKACARICRAMIAHPFLISGTGRLDTDLMTVTKGAVVAKIGADGVYALAVPEKGWGLAAKVEDGNMKVLGPIILEALSQLGLLSAEQRKALAAHDRYAVKNNVKEVVGETRAAFTLEG